jgi:hypothetical protein
VEIADRLGVPKPVSVAPAKFSVEAEDIGLSKYCGAPAETPAEIDSAHLNSLEEIPCKSYKILDDEEVIVGVDVSKSGGFNGGLFCKHKCKREYEECTHCRKVVRMMQDGEIPLSYIIPFVLDFLKDEQRDVAKPARNINNVPWFAWHILSRIARPFFDIIEETARSNWEFGLWIGNSYEYGGASRLHAKLTRQYPEALPYSFSADVVRWDSLRFKSLKYSTWLYIFGLVQDQLSNSERACMHHLIYFLSKGILVVKSCGDVVLIERGEISGDVTTLMYNSLILKSVYLAYCAKINIARDMTNFMILGDNLASATIGVTFEGFRSYCNTIGLDITGCSGSWTSDLDFLSSKFVKVGRVGDHYLPCNVNEEKILSSLRCAMSKDLTKIWAHIVGIRSSCYGNKRLFDICSRVCEAFYRKFPNFCKTPVMPSPFALYQLYVGEERSRVGLEGSTGIRDISVLVKNFNMGGGKPKTVGGGNAGMVPTPVKVIIPPRAFSKALSTQQKAAVTKQLKKNVSSSKREMREIVNNLPSGKPPSGIVSQELRKKTLLAQNAQQRYNEWIAALMTGMGSPRISEKNPYPLFPLQERNVHGIEDMGYIDASYPAGKQSCGHIVISKQNNAHIRAVKPDSSQGFWIEARHSANQGVNLTPNLPGDATLPVLINASGDMSGGSAEGLRAAYNTANEYTFCGIVLAMSNGSTLRMGNSTTSPGWINTVAGNADIIVRGKFAGNLAGTCTLRLYEGENINNSIVWTQVATTVNPSGVDFTSWFSAVALDLRYYAITAQFNQKYVSELSLELIQTSVGTYAYQPFADSWSTDDMFVSKLGLVRTIGKAALFKNVSNFTEVQGVIGAFLVPPGSPLDTIPAEPNKALTQLQTYAAHSYTGAAFEGIHGFLPPSDEWRPVNTTVANLNEWRLHIVWDGLPNEVDFELIVTTCGVAQVRPNTIFVGEIYGYDPALEAAFLRFNSQIPIYIGSNGQHWDRIRAMFKTIGNGVWNSSARKMLQDALMKALIQHGGTLASVAYQQALAAIMAG